jgi:hypothetical protein
MVEITGSGFAFVVPYSCHEVKIGRRSDLVLTCSNQRIRAGNGICTPAKAS